MKAFNVTVNEAKSSAVVNQGKGIQKAFKDIITFALPHPGIAVTTSSVSDGKVTISSIDRKHVLAVKALFRDIFVIRPQQASKVLGRTLAKSFAALEKRTVDSDVGRIRIKTSSEALEESVMHKAFVEALKYYDYEMIKILNAKFESVQIARITLESVLKETIRRFRENKAVRKYGATTAMIVYLGLLQSKRETIDQQLHIIHELKMLERKVELAEAKAEEDKRIREEEERQRAVDNEKGDSKEVEEGDKNITANRGARTKELGDLKKEMVEDKAKIDKLVDVVDGVNDKEVLNPEQTWTKEVKKKKSRCTIL